MSSEGWAHCKASWGKWEHELSRYEKVDDA